MIYVILCALAMFAVATVGLYANRKELLKVIADRDERLDASTREVVELQTNLQAMMVKAQDAQNAAAEINGKLLEQISKNNEILSQKKSSETRLGQISEHLVPFLGNCPYDPKNLHFLGNPIDYISFDYDEGSITLIEIKSGNSKPSKRQKLIKKIIESGNVYYDEIRINEKGVKVKSEGQREEKSSEQSVLP